MSMFIPSIRVRWRVLRRRRRAGRKHFEALRQLNDHLLKDIGLPIPRSTDDPWV